MSTFVGSSQAMLQDLTKSAPAWEPRVRLSAQPTARLEVKCDRCSRRGRFTAFRLFAEFGDKFEGLPLLHEIARKAGCDRAKNPPHPGEMRYLERVCEIRQVTAADDYVPTPTVYSRMHQGWRLLLVCARHHQGLKSAKPCPGPPAEMDLRTLMASLGHDFPVDRLPGKLVAPCCATQSIELHWIAPAAKDG